MCIPKNLMAAFFVVKGYGIGCIVVIIPNRIMLIL